MTTMETRGSDIEKLFTTVVEGGYCVGCGACASVKDSPISMELDEYSKFKAVITQDLSKIESEISVQKVCPFSNESLNEDKIGLDLFGEHGTYHDKIGYNIINYAGHVVEGSFRDSGSSGGMGTWIAYKLLEKGEVDSVIHVHQRSPTPDDPRLFHYQLSDSLDSVSKSAKSRYYPIELSEMVKLIKVRQGKYAIIGIPCFIKALRLLSNQDSVIKERIKFCIGLICGHLKSTRFAEMLGWEMGVKHNELISIDFRHKIEGESSNRYGVTIRGTKNDELVEKNSPPVHEMYGTNWGYGFFKYKACDYCDDVVAETADVTVGDAWLPQYVNDSKGTNVVVVRNLLIKQIIEEARSQGKLNLDIISTDEVVKSQKSGFDHRRDGLAFRLHLADQKKQWRPIKRIAPNADKNDNYKQKQILRMKIAEQSHIAFNKAIAKDSFPLFKNELNPMLRAYNRLYAGPLYKRVINKFKKVLKINL